MGQCHSTPLLVEEYLFTLFDYALCETLIVLLEQKM